MRRAARRPLLRIFAIPIALAASTAIGLAAGVLGDGIWDVVSWVALGLLLAMVAWHGIPVRRDP